MIHIEPFSLINFKPHVDYLMLFDEIAAEKMNPRIRIKSRW